MTYYAIHRTSGLHGWYWGGREAEDGPWTRKRSEVRYFKTREDAEKEITRLGLEHAEVVPLSDGD